MHDPLRVLVVEPHRGMRTSLCTVLSVEDGIHVAAAAADMLGAVRQARRVHADVALVDDRAAALGKGSPAEAIGELAKRLPVVVIGMGEAAAYARIYMEAGASGYWCKTAGLDELTLLLRDAATTRRRAA